MRDALKEGTPLPTTSQPSLQVLQSSYEEALLQHKDVIALTLSSELSGTYGSSRIARSMLSNKQRLTIYDTGIIDAGEGLVVVGRGVPSFKASLIFWYAFSFVTFFPFGNWATKGISVILFFSIKL
ncbi:MAG TPA: hypothetical protein ENI04_00445 [Candidatus Wildermuthbacteria bacterium]|nr:hypothetical protein [Candidatus Wildermuthbacteria bacterium]